MKPRIVLLYTCDQNFDRVLTEALYGTGTIILIARSVSDALQIVCRRGSELDFAMIDFNDGCRGMTLVSALHTCHQQLPILVTTSDDAEHSTAVGYANGARAYLNKPLQAAMLANVIAGLKGPHHQPVAA